MSVLQHDVVFYNLDNNRPDNPVAEELHGIEASRPDVVGLVETIGNRLVDLDGYRLIRDTSTDGRANIAAYVRRELTLDHVEWHPMSFTWPRTEGPGRHPAREALSFDAGGVQYVLAHQPPRNALGFIQGQREQMEKIVSLAAPWTRGGFINRARTWQQGGYRKKRVVLADWNWHRGLEGPSPVELARRMGGAVMGEKIDAAVVRGWDRVQHRYMTRIGGVNLRSDHGHCLWLTLKQAR